MRARNCIEAGRIEELGACMNAQPQPAAGPRCLLAAARSIVEAAPEAGAFGAKLSGAGLGGNIIALVAPERLER